MPLPESEQLARQWFGNRGLTPGLSKRCGHMRDADIFSLRDLIEKVRRIAGSRPGQFDTEPFRGRCALCRDSGIAYNASLTEIYCTCPVGVALKVEAAPEPETRPCPVCGAEASAIWSDNRGCEHCTREATVDELNALLATAIRERNEARGELKTIRAYVEKWREGLAP